MNPPVPPSRHSTPSGNSCFSRAFTMWTPTPSSPIRTLPSPTTSVFLSAATDSSRATGRLVPSPWSVRPWPCRSWLFDPIELPSAHDGGDRAAAFNVVVVEGKIHVNHDESHKEP